MKVIGVIVLLLALATRGVAVALPNDACVDATPVDDGFTQLFVSTPATTAPDDPFQSCTIFGPRQNLRSVWYRFVAPANGYLTVETLNTAFPADPPTIVSVHVGACGTLTEIACADSPTPFASTVTTAVDLGVAYLVEITNRLGSLGGLVAVAVHFEPDSPICADDGGTILRAELSLNGFRPPTEDLRLKVRLAALLPAPLPDVAASGVQFVVENLSAHYAPIVEWSAPTLAVPSGGPGTGCDPRDGWKAAKSGSSFRYRNLSNALPPTCAPGSANGLTEIRLLRKSKDMRMVDVKIRAKETALLSPIEDGALELRVALTLDAGLGEGTEDRCAVSRRPIACTRNRSGVLLSCKLD
jgi:hypothetical protein